MNKGCGTTKTKESGYFVRLCPAVSGSFLLSRTGITEINRGFRCAVRLCPAVLQLPYVTRARKSFLLSASSFSLYPLGYRKEPDTAGQVVKCFDFVSLFVSGSWKNNRTQPDTAGQEA